METKESVERNKTSPQSVEYTEQDLLSYSDMLESELASVERIKKLAQ